MGGVLRDAKQTCRVQVEFKTIWHGQAGDIILRFCEPMDRERVSDVWQGDWPKRGPPWPCFQKLLRFLYLNQQALRFGYNLLFVSLFASVARQLLSC